jgi:SWI/SNF-related matrix-associated actin-dependent regulator 1 of chromatin subfamily A
MIFFQSHYLKSETALRTKHTLPLLSQSRRCVLLSGTPCLSRPIELFTQIHALQPALFVHRQQFGIRYCAGVQGKFGWEFTGASNLTELHSLLKRFTMIRRLKVEVLTDLPPKRRQTVVFRIKDAEIQQSMREIEEKRLLKAIDSEEQSTRPDKVLFHITILNTVMIMFVLIFQT